MILRLIFIFGITVAEEKDKSEFISQVCDKTKVEVRNSIKITDVRNLIPK
jgi:hypothetical protein